MLRALEIQSAGGEEGGLPVPRTARSGVCGTLPGSRSRGRSSKAKPSNLEVGQKATRQVSGLSESFHVWKNAIARSIVTGVPWRLWGSAQRDAGATGRCPLKGVGAGGEVLEGNVDGARMPLSLRVTARRSHTGSSHSKVKCGQSACSRGRSCSGLSHSWPRTRTTVLPPHSST